MADTPSKLTRTVIRAEGATLVRLEGVIDADTKPEQLLEGTQGAIVFDLDGVKRITSYGVREWVRAVSTVLPGQLYFIKCRPAMVSQFNMVAGFRGNGEILSLYLPYVCDECGEEVEVLSDTRADRATLLVDEPPPRPCPKCGAEAVFDDIANSYLACVTSRPVPVVPPAVKRLLDGGSAVPQRLKVQKEIKNDVTALWLSGPLDERTRFKRTIDGIEGTLVVVVAGVTDVRGGQLASVVDLPDVELCFARVRPSFLDALPGDLRARVASRVISHLVPGHCPNCGNSEADVSLIGLQSGNHTCFACGAPAKLTLTPEQVGQLAQTTLRPRDDVKEYLDTHPGSALHDLEDGEVSTKIAQAFDPQAAGAKYRVVSRLGAGGMAEVVLAEQKGPEGFRKQVVLKRILPAYAERKDFVQMFLNEARVAALITHPNVVQIFDLGQDAGHYFIAMEYVRGSDLQGILRLAFRNGIKVPAPLAGRVVADMCAGLHAAHTATDPSGNPLNVIHRDVSPHNVLLSNDGVVKIVDFGISKVAGQASGTKPGQVKGKVIYMAPEQIDPRMGVVDARADVFAAGLVLHHMLTGRPTFLRDSEVESLEAVLRGPIPSIREFRAELPADLDRIVNKALERDRAYRYPSAEALKLDLERFLSSTGDPATSTHLAKWVAWLRGVDQSRAEEVDVVVDVGSIDSQASTRIVTPTGKPIPDDDNEA